MPRLETQMALADKQSWAQELGQEWVQPMFGTVLVARRAGAGERPGRYKIGY